MINPEDEKYFQVKLRDFITQEFSTGSKNAIEAAIFLYLNKERSFPDREIFENVKENIKTNGKSPERTFSTEVRKYTINSPQKLTVSHKKLFAITDLEESPQRFLLIEDVRNTIVNHFNSQKSKEVLWKCPKDSCNFKEIKISRNNDNIIDSKTYTDITIHFLQHLSQENPLFGSTDIIKIFLDHAPKEILSVEDKGEYIYDGRTSDKIWKNQIRSALNSLRSKGYIDTENSLDVIEKFSKNVKDRRKLRKRKRTDLFKTGFDLYDDWKIIQTNGKIEKEKKYWIFQSNPSIYNLEKAIKELEIDTFTVNQHTEEIQKDDRVIFWTSGGDDAGIVGYGKVLSNPKLMVPYEKGSKYVMDSSKVSNELKLRVMVTYNSIKSKMTKLVLEKLLGKYNIDFSEISIIKQPRGTNFSVDKVVWEILQNKFNDESQKLLCCRTGWMKEYKGITENDKIVGGGSFVKNRGYGSEIQNFKPNQGYYYGFVQANSNTINLNRLGATDDQESIDNVNVVWVATLESGGQVIYGYYKNATIFRKTQQPEEELDRIHESYILHYNIQANTKDCKLIPEKDRNIEVPFAKEEGYGFGMSNVWYAKEEDAKEYRKKILDYIYKKRSYPKDKTDIDEIQTRNFISFLLEKETRITVSKQAEIIIEEVLKLLTKRKQVILIGPPGTGKTYLAKIIANRLTGRDVKHVNLIQFHPEYSYENFIECLQIKSGSDMELEQKVQIFRRICKDAFDSKINALNAIYRNEQNSLTKNKKIKFLDWYEEKINSNLDYLTDEIPKFVLIIDEINRGDLSRIFGEAIMALEYRDTPIKTMYFDEDDPLIIPDNLYIIGTMNSVDRSIAILDYALRRRFLFYEVKPNRAILEEWLEESKSEVKDDILKVFDRLNDEKKGWINNTWEDSPQLASNFQIGHTYFFHKTKEQFQIEWEYSIVPLLIEYMNFSNELMNSFQENFDLKDPIIIP